MATRPRRHFCIWDVSTCGEPSNQVSTLRYFGSPYLLFGGLQGLEGYFKVFLKMPSGK